MVLSDVRANLGYYTALAIPRLGGGRIIALDPDRENFRYLRRTVQANGPSDTICIRKAAAEYGTLSLLTSARRNEGGGRSHHD